MHVCAYVCMCALRIYRFGSVRFGTVRFGVHFCINVDGACDVRNIYATSFFDEQIESACDSCGAGLVSLRRNIVLLVDEHCGKYDSFGTDGITAYSWAIFDFKSTISLSFCRMTSRANKQRDSFEMVRSGIMHFLFQFVSTTKEQNKTITLTVTNFQLSLCFTQSRE